MDTLVILNMSDILVPFGHFWKFWSFWTFGPLVMTDILYVGQFGHFLVTSETLDNCALVKSSLTFLLACMSKILINS